MKKSELESKINSLKMKRKERSRFGTIAKDELETAKKKGLKTRADQLDEIVETESAALVILDIRIKAANARLKKFN